LAFIEYAYGYEDSLRVSLAELGNTANAASARWDASGELPIEVAELRALLYFEQRRHRHLEDPRPF
jgi:hypothetical protein